jgi:hypothetical protein
MHFTYAPPDPQSLQQGDILRRTAALDEILRRFHSHYVQAVNEYFAVLTQSCDLVRRGGICGTRYVSVAAVRPVKMAVEREIETHYGHEVERRLRFSDDSGRARTVNFVERLLNNNEDEYFFLYREPSIGFDNDQCIFLPLSVPLKTQHHYDTLLEAKILQLRDDFQHKLGYLVGKMYGRVGTADWVPTVDSTAEAFRVRADSYVTEISKELQMFWLPRDQHRAVTKVLRSLADSDATLERLKTEIENAKGKKDATVAQAVNVVEEALREEGVPNELIERATRHLTTLTAFRGLIR